MMIIRTKKRLELRGIGVVAFVSFAASALGACSSNTDSNAGNHDDAGSVNPTDGGSGSDSHVQSDSPAPPVDAPAGQNDSSSGHDSSSGGDATCGTFTAHGDDVTDSSTSLVWKRTILDTRNFAQAQSACASWEAGGRLPTKDELLAVIPHEEPCKTALGWTEPFSGELAWTSTPYPSGQDNYYIVYFDPNASPTFAPSTDGEWVRCVH